MYGVQATIVSLRMYLKLMLWLLVGFALLLPIIARNVGLQFQDIACYVIPAFGQTRPAFTYGRQHVGDRV